MHLFAQQSSPRLQYMANWLGNYLFGKPLTVITSQNELTEENFIFNYAHETIPFLCFHIQPHSILFEQNIHEQNIEIKYHKTFPYFFETSGDYPFDILAASFYLLQRYEEYLPHQKDLYGRYAHTNSIAFKQDFLHLPLVDIWMQQLKESLYKKFPGLQFKQRQFHFLPTYDIDIAYSYKGKGIFRNIWGLYRSLATGRMDDFMGRIGFLLEGKEDPFDVFEELDSLHEQHHLHPIYFMLLAQKQRGIDKNIHPYKKVYRQLIARLAKQYPTGIHLSGAASFSFSTMKKEKDILTKITGAETTINRMHYLLFHLPETYRQLQQLPVPIVQEYSMGYGSINGFRASTCTPYLWYDLALEKCTTLQILPFCYMEANTIFEQKDSPTLALEEMMQFYNIIKQVDGQFITIFHNHLIGKNEEGRQWMRMYQQFLSFLPK